MLMLNIDSKFREYFPNLASKFELKEFQKRVIDNIVQEGNTLCIMPTGGGKSLTYWMSGMILGGITIVISPLIALIDEQSEKIREQGIEVLTIHGDISAKQQTKLLKDFANKKFNPKFIFASPEKIATDGLFEYCISKRKEDITMFAIDEVHCVSQWGTNFRPFYKHIPNFIAKVFDENSKPKTLALTATLNPKEVNDICTEFEIDKSNIIKDNLLMRSEITLKVLKFSKEDEKDSKLDDLLQIHKNEKTLVYVYRKKGERGVKGLCQRAIDNGHKAMYFHGDMKAKERKNIIYKFKNNEIDVVFATNAFGMGIDIPDIRNIIHFMIPESVEQYYQEVGRAARDGNSANAYLLYTNKNIDVKRKHFIDSSFPNEENLLKSYEMITKNKEGLSTLPFFDESEEVQTSFSYFVNEKIIDIKGKGFADFKFIEETESDYLNKLINSTKTKNIITTIKKTGEGVEDILNNTYKCIVNEEIRFSKKGLDKRLIIDTKKSQISEVSMKNIHNYINNKRQYKHELLDYLVYLIDSNNYSNELHQEIGRYFGVDKHSLGKIYKTSKGDFVRSKSEVIIANLLHSQGINYEYEARLYYEDKKWIEPDFTIILSNGNKIYWEHVGMLGVESYDNRWIEKKEIYSKYYNGMLKVTYEGASITDSSMKIIEEDLLKK